MDCAWGCKESDMIEQLSFWILSPDIYAVKVFGKKSELHNKFFLFMYLEHYCFCDDAFS